MIDNKHLVTEAKLDESKIDVRDITEQALMAFWSEIDDMTPDLPNQVEAPDNSKITKMMMKEVADWIKKGSI